VSGNPGGSNLRTGRDSPHAALMLAIGGGGAVFTFSIAAAEASVIAGAIYATAAFLLPLALERIMEQRDLGIWIPILLAALMAPLITYFYFQPSNYFQPSDAAVRRQAQVTSQGSSPPQVTSAQVSDPSERVAKAEGSASLQVRGTPDRLQAQAIEKLLDQAAKIPDVPTIADPLILCDASSTTVSETSERFQDTQRRYSQLRSLLKAEPMNRIPNGQSLRTTLDEVWKQKEESAVHYFNWARGIATGTRCNLDSPFRAAGNVVWTSSNKHATIFVNEWNDTVAKPLNLTERRAHDL
jgi:hypothetical protein